MKTLVKRSTVFCFLFILSSFGRAFRIDVGTLGRAIRNQLQLDRDRSLSTLHAEKKRFKNFDQVLDEFHDEPVVIYFSRLYCGPCRLMRKELQVVNTEMGDAFKMFRIDTEKWPKIASRMEVSTLPCLVLCLDGEVKLRLEGVVPAETIIEQINSLM